MRLRKVTVLAGVLLVLSACSSTYEEREKYLDKMTDKGLEYRVHLQTQKTEPLEQACVLGWNLLSPGDVPGVPSGMDYKTWQGQVREAYLKACMTGQKRPKPDPSGVKAVTPVPFTSSPASLSPSPSPSPSAS